MDMTIPQSTMRIPNGAKIVVPCIPATTLLTNSFVIQIESPGIVALIVNTIRKAKVYIGDACQKIGRVRPNKLNNFLLEAIIIYIMQFVNRNIRSWVMTLTLISSYGVKVVVQASIRKELFQGRTRAADHTQSQQAQP